MDSIKTFISTVTNTKSEQKNLPGSSRTEEAQDTFTPSTESQDELAEKRKMAELVRRARAQGQQVNLEPNGNGGYRVRFSDPQFSYLQFSKDYLGSDQHLKDAKNFAIGEAKTAVSPVTGMYNVGKAGVNGAANAWNDPAGAWDQGKRAVVKGLKRAENTAKRYYQDPSAVVQDAKSGAGRAYENAVRPFREGDMQGAGGVTMTGITTVVTGVGGVVKSVGKGAVAKTTVKSTTSQNPVMAAVGGTTKKKKKGKPKPPAASSVSAALAAKIKQFPRSPSKGYGHSHKHAPKTATEVATAIGKLKPGKKATTWFKDQKAMDAVIQGAPDYLPEILKNSKRAADFDDFVNNPAVKKRFGFRIPLAKNQGRGVKMDAAGQVHKLRKLEQAYVEYAWVAGKGGKLELKLKTAYPMVAK